MWAGPSKGSDSRSLLNSVDIMKLITAFELASYNRTELHGLYRKTFNELARSESETSKRRNALASLENIRREIALRLQN